MLWSTYKWTDGEDEVDDDEQQHSEVFDAHLDAITSTRSLHTEHSHKTTQQILPHTVWSAIVVILSSVCLWRRVLCPIHVHGVGQTKFSVDVHLYVRTCVRVYILCARTGSHRSQCTWRATYTGRLASSQTVNNVTDVSCGQSINQSIISLLGFYMEE